MSRASRNNERVAKNLPNASNRPSTLNATTSNDLLVESSQSSRTNATTSNELLVESSQSSGTNATTSNYLPNRHRATVSEETASNSDSSRTLKGYPFIYFLTSNYLLIMNIFKL